MAFPYPANAVRFNYGLIPARPAALCVPGPKPTSTALTGGGTRHPPQQRGRRTHTEGKEGDLRVSPYAGHADPHNTTSNRTGCRFGVR